MAYWYGEVHGLVLGSWLYWGVSKGWRAESDRQTAGSRLLSAGIGVQETMRVLSSIT